MNYLFLFLLFPFHLILCNSVNPVYWSYAEYSGNVPYKRKGSSSTVFDDTYIALYSGSTSINDAFCYLNDLWLLDTVSSSWNCVSGNCNVNSNYVCSSSTQKGEFHVNNQPGGRIHSIMKSINSDELLVFSGVGFGHSLFKGATCYYAVMNDLWIFSRSQGYWSLESGGHPDYMGRFSVKGEYSPDNLISSRSESMGIFFDEVNLFYVYGGVSVFNPLTGMTYIDQFCDDVWSYNVTSRMWNWETGYQEHVSRVPDEESPGGRSGGVVWKISVSEFMLFSGRMYDFDTDLITTLNDIWVYNIGSRKWTKKRNNTDLYITDHEGRYNSTYYSIKVTNQFDPRNVPIGRRKSAITNFPGTGYLALYGGEMGDQILYSDNYYYQTIKEFWVLDTSTFEWAYIKVPFDEVFFPVKAVDKDHSDSYTSPGPMSEHFFHTIGNKLYLGYGSQRDMYTNVNDDGDHLVAYYYGPSSAVVVGEVKVPNICFNISEIDENVCSGRGRCVDEDTCATYRRVDYWYSSDSNGYYLENFYPKYYGENLESPLCFGFQLENSCSGDYGTCVDYNTCVCEDDHFGEKCNKFDCWGYIDSPTYRSDGCNGEGYCVGKNKCKCTSYSDYFGKRCDETVDQSTVLFIIGVALAFAAAYVGFVCATCVICFCQCTKNRRKKLKMLKELGFETILEEQKLAKDTSIAHINVNKKLFEVDAADIEILETIDSERNFVYKARLKSRIVAYKCFNISDVLAQDKYKAFENEVQLLSSLHHPNIVQFHGAILKEPKIEFLDRFRKRNNTPYPFRFKIDLLIQIVNALIFLHQRKIIHRNIKPESILIDKMRVVKLTGFSLSKFIQDTSRVMTRNVGIDIFRSPQVTLGKIYDSLADVFSIGMLIYCVIQECWSAEEIFGKNVCAIDLKMASDENFRPLIDNKSFRNLVSLIDLTKKCWSHDPNERDSSTNVLKKLNEIKESIKEINVALVVGIGKYDELYESSTSLNDSNRMKELLDSVGFDTSYHENVEDRDDLVDCFTDFVKKRKKVLTDNPQTNLNTLIYFSGNVMLRNDNKCFFLPSDFKKSDLKSLRKLYKKSLGIDKIKRSIPSGKCIIIVQCKNLFKGDVKNEEKEEEEVSDEDEDEKTQPTGEKQQDEEVVEDDENVAYSSELGEEKYKNVTGSAPKLKKQSVNTNEDKKTVSDTGFIICYSHHPTEVYIPGEKDECQRYTDVLAKNLAKEKNQNILEIIKNSQFEVNISSGGKQTPYYESDLPSEWIWNQY